MQHFRFLIFILFVGFGCSEEIANEPQINSAVAEKLTIFFVNDQHGQLENFAKIKDIVDKEKQKNNVLLVCSGDIFSGNPVVDYYPEKGLPIIDVMNRTGFDISVIGNHEFDYGQDILKKRMAQANFDWVCANVDMGTTNIPEPAEYKTLQVDDLKVTFLGLVETNGKKDGTIPSTHPGKVKNFVFQRPENVAGSYANIKKQEDSDLFIALTHLGTGGDFKLAADFPYFDLIIGGHSHQRVNEKVNGIPVYQTRGKLRSLGKIEMTIENKEIVGLDYTLIDLNSYSSFDADLKAVIDGYNNEMTATIDVKVGNSVISHSRSLLGCFYTDALTSRMNVDLSFQNTGGIRAGLNQGEITKREIYAMDPFNNTAYIYQMSVAEVKRFLIGSQSGFYYSGSQISQNGDEIEIRNSNGTLLADNDVLSIGINDYIPAVNDTYFPQNPSVQSYTTAEALIYYLENTNNQVNYPSCGQYFEYE